MSQSIFHAEARRRPGYEVMRSLLLEWLANGPPDAAQMFVRHTRFMLEGWHIQGAVARIRAEVKLGIVREVYGI